MMKNYSNVYMVSVVLAALVMVYYFGNNKQDNVDASINYKLLETISGDLKLLNKNILHLGEQLEYITQNKSVNMLGDAYSNNEGIDVGETVVEEENLNNESLSGIEQLIVTEEHNSKKFDILAALNNSSVTLTDIMESPDMKQLPVELQHEIMEEVVVRFNSGELTKSQFIPGYKE